MTSTTCPEEISVGRCKHLNVAAFVLTFLLLSGAAGLDPAARGDAPKPDAPGSAQGKTADSSAAGRARTLNRIFAAWKARHDRVKSFHFSWVSRAALPKGFTFGLTPTIGGLKDPGYTVEEEGGFELKIPESDLWVDDQSHVRDDFVEVAHEGPKKWKEAARIRKIVDGTKISLLTTPLGTGESPRIAIWAQASVANLSAFAWRDTGAWRDARVLDWSPLRLTFRALDPALGWSLSETCHVVDDAAVIDNVPCVTVQMDALDRSEMCWVDPSRDDIIVRWERRQGAANPVVISIEYQRDKDYGWVPSRWKREFQGAEPSDHSVLESTVTHYAINEKIPADTFACTYPTNTRVFDVSAGELAPAGKQSPPASGQSGPKAGAKEASSPAKGAGPSLEQIVEAWTKRQSATKSLKFTWRGERITPEGQTAEKPHSALIDGEEFAYVEDQDPYPPDIASVVLDRERGPSASDNRTSSRNRPTTASVPPARRTFDGTSTRTYRALNDRTITGVGSIQPGFQIPDAKGPGLEPVMLMYRPFDPNLGGIVGRDFELAGQRGKIDGVSCVIIEKIGEPGQRLRTLYWLDPQRDCIVLRKQRTNHGRDFERMDVSYRKDPASGWVPSACKMVRLRDSGNSCQSYAATISNVSINQAIPSTEFLVDFPKGTKVHELDRRSGQAGAGRSLSALRGGASPPTPKAPPNPNAKPLYNPFADAVADVDAAIKTAKGSHKRVLVILGDNSMPESLTLYPFLEGNAELSSMIGQGFIVVLVDLFSASGRTVEEKYFNTSHPQHFAHVGILDGKGEILQYQPTTWFHGSGNRYDAARIKKLLSYWIVSE
jgi:hypothetical protein